VNQNNGQDPQGQNPNEPTPEQIAQMRDQAIQQSAMEIGAMLAAFFPNLPDEARTKLSSMHAQAQLPLSQVLQDALDDSSREKNPYWGFHVADKKGNRGTVLVPKDPSRCTTLDQKSQYAQIVAYLTSPSARAMLNAMGLKIEFHQAPSLPRNASSKILRP